MEMSLFQHPQLDGYLFSFLDLEALISLIQMNTHYWITIRKSKYFRIMIFYVNNQKDLTKTFINECVHGTLETVQWLFDHHQIFTFFLEQENIINEYGDKPFCEACKHSKLDIAEYLLTKAFQLNRLVKSNNLSHVFYSPTINKSAFRDALLERRLTDAIWIYQKSIEFGEPYDLEDGADGAWYDDIYTQICREGFRWLFTTKIPCPEICTRAFNEACINKHLEIAYIFYEHGY